MQLWKFRSHVSQTAKVLALDGPAVAGTSLTLRDDDNSMSRLFQFMHTGLIVPALNSTMAVTASTNGTVTLQPADSGNANQKWTKTDDPWATLTNGGTGMLLTVVQSSTQGWIVNAQAAKEPAYGQLWAQKTDFAACNYLLTTIVNSSANALYVTVNDDVEGKCPITGQVPLAPNSSLTFWSEYSGGLVIPTQIWDPNVSTTHSVASFVAHQKRCILSALPWLDTVNYVDGYTLTWTATESSSADELPGLIYATVQYVGS